jgi:hypothetical protein
MNKTLSILVLTIVCFITVLNTEKLMSEEEQTQPAFNEQQAIENLKR